MDGRLVKVQGDGLFITTKVVTEVGICPIIAHLKAIIPIAPRLADLPEGVGRYDLGGRDRGSLRPIVKNLMAKVKEHPGELVIFLSKGTRGVKLGARQMYEAEEVKSHEYLFLSWSVISLRSSSGIRGSP
jgi:hypothetical protein